MEYERKIFAILEAEWLKNANKVIKKKVRVLCIDGDYSSSVGALKCLELLQTTLRQTTGDPNARITDCFDMAAGSGLGAMAVSALFAKANKTSGKSIMEPKEVLEFIKTKHKKLYNNKSGKIWQSTKEPKYSSHSLQKELKNLFGDKTLKDFVKPVLIPCYDAKTSSNFTFSSPSAVRSETYDFRIWEACCASMATVGQFSSPFQCRSVDGKTVCMGIGGTVAANNPSMIAVSHVINNGVDFSHVHGVHNVALLSIGGGGAEKKDTSVVEIGGNAVSEAVDQTMRMSFINCPANYLRLHVTQEEEMLDDKYVMSMPLGYRVRTSVNNAHMLDIFAGKFLL